MRTRTAVFQFKTNQPFQKLHFQLPIPNDCDHVYAIQVYVKEKLPVHNFAYQRWGRLRLSNWEELIFETTLRDESERPTFERNTDMEFSSSIGVLMGKAEPCEINISRNATLLDGVLFSDADQLFTLCIHLYYKTRL